ncbi:MAG: hypothetical protein K2H38_10765 [Muribaculaceae bacterium]|nr:hypothetical protein [Muribaculaceae bacterium]MDE6554233.1 hypothetical protein [Muribaculaceae bacterium]
MKKLYKSTLKSAAIMSLALMANVAVGQNLKVTANGKPVSNGDVIEVQCELEDYTQDFGFLFVHYVWNPHLEASIPEGEANLAVTLTQVEGQTPFEICWPIQCIVYENGIASASGKIGTTPANIEIHIMGDITDDNKPSLDGGMSKVRMECGSEKLEFTLKGLPADLGAVDENLAEDFTTAEYFTIQGLRVAEPQKGQLVIERKGGKVAKRIF